MTFFRRLLVLAIGTCFAGSVCLAQRPDEFAWDYHKVEKDGWSSISESQDLSAEQRADLMTVMAMQFRPFKSNLGIESEAQLRDIVAQTRIKTVDLGGKGVREFAVQSTGNRSCSPTGNCEFWIFHRTRDGYLLILHSLATQTFTIQPAITNGYHDIVLGRHGSAFKQGLYLYRFDGSKYRRAACYDANWEIRGKDGEVRDLKDPRITPCNAK
jgi:hypothetical protein